MAFNERLFWSKVDKTSTCWLWTGHLDRDGYGEFNSDALTTRKAHRISYALDNGGELPDMPLDHLCRNRHCVNPDHLEPVTVATNTRRGNAGVAESERTHCPQEHEYTEANTIRRNGKRRCRECHNRENREARARKREQA